MSTSSMITNEARRFRMAEKYQQLGYRVKISPPAKDSPKFLSKFKPDIVAEGPNESVVIEVTSSNEERGAAYRKELASVVQKHPKWRIELIANALQRSSRKPMNKDLVGKRLEEGQRLAEQGMFAASLLITWSAVEAAVRLTAKQHEIDLPDQRPATHSGSLYLDGVLARREYDILVEAFGVRNAVSHWFDKRRLGDRS